MPTAVRMAPIPAITVMSVRKKPGFWTEAARASPAVTSSLTGWAGSRA